MSARQKPGYRWRIGWDRMGRNGHIVGDGVIEHQPDERLFFDELVVQLGENSCLHVEAMDSRSWFIGIGEAQLWVRVKPNGKLTLTFEPNDQPVEGLPK